MAALDVSVAAEYLTPEEIQVAKFGAAAKRAAGSTILDTATAAK